MRHFGSALLCAVVLSPSVMHGAAGDVRATLEPGVGALSVTSSTQIRAQDLWGALGGVTVAVGLDRLVWLQVHADHKRFPKPDPDLGVTSFGAALVYNIDVLDVTPFLEGGVVAARFRGPNTQDDVELGPFLGAGLDTRLSARLFTGLIVRYHALFNSALLSNPAYTSINLRLGWLPMGGP